MPRDTVLYTAGEMLHGLTEWLKKNYIFKKKYIRLWQYGFVIWEQLFY